MLEDLIKYSKSEDVPKWDYSDTIISVDGKDRAFMDIYSEALGLLSYNSESQIAKAQDLFETLACRFPFFTESYFQIARIEFARGNEELAFDLARNGLKSGFVSPNYIILMVAFCYHFGLFSDAIAIKDFYISEYADKKPAHPNQVQYYAPELVTMRGEQHLVNFIKRMLGNVFSDYLLYERKLVHKEIILNTLITNLTLSASQKKSQDKLEPILSFLETYPRLGELRFYLIRYLTHAGREKEALRHALEGTECSDMDWPCHVYAGLLSYNLGQKDSFLSHFRQAALVNENLPLLTPRTAKQEKELVGWFQNMIDLLPSYVGAYNEAWVYPDQLAWNGSQEIKNENATLRLALKDLRETIKNRRGWIAMAKNDIVSRYRRTVLGPWWIVLGTGLALTGMSLVWSMLFGMTMQEYFPYTSAGYITWMFISSTMMEGCNTYIDGQATAIMKNISMSKSLHVARLVLRNIIIFVHSLAIFVFGALIFGVDVNLNTLLLIPGMLLLFLTAFAVAQLFAIIGLRYRDFGPALGAILTVLFLVTPVLWKTEQLEDRGYYAFFNPLTHYISIIREPLLGKAPLLLSYGVVSGLAILFWSLAIYALAKSRNRIVFWL